MEAASSRANQDSTTVTVAVRLLRSIPRKVKTAAKATAEPTTMRTWNASPPRPNPQGPIIGMPAHPPMSHAAVKNRDAVRTVRKLAR